MDLCIQAVHTFGRRLQRQYVGVSLWSLIRSRAIPAAQTPDGQMECQAKFWGNGHQKVGQTYIYTHVTYFCFALQSLYLSIRSFFYSFFLIRIHLTHILKKEEVSQLEMVGIRVDILILAKETIICGCSKVTLSLTYWPTHSKINIDILKYETHR